MTSKEIVKAMEDKIPVMAKGIQYRTIREFILTIDDSGQQRKSVSLLDKNGKSLVRVLISDVQPVESPAS